jgi:DNA-binding NarL/FixJ family response regulator
MVPVAIYSADPGVRNRLEQLLRGAPTIEVIGVAEDEQALSRLIEQNRIDVLLVDRLPQSADQLASSQTPALVVIGGEEDDLAGLDALYGGAHSILPDSADGSEVVAAIAATSRNLAVIPHRLLATLLDARSLDRGEVLDDSATGGASLTPRELEVLAAMADGASNKAIARRLGISFHTVKFHVAAILAKLDADTRTEAVAKAAHLGLVML